MDFFLKELNCSITQVNKSKSSEVSLFEFCGVFHARFKSVFSFSVACTVFVIIFGEIVGAD